MDRKDVHTFIKALSGPNALVDDHENWVNSPCPLAKWTHERGTDRSPSFGISIDPMSSRYHCFTCGSRGALLGLVKKLSRLSGKAYPLLEEYVEAEEVGGIVPEWEGDEDLLEHITKLSEDTIYMYDLVGDNKYLRGRETSADLANSLGLRVDYAEETSDNRERIMFPVYSTQGGLHLAGFTGRATDREKVLKVKDYYGLKKSEALLGVERITDEHKFIAVVEGLFAYVRMSSYGVPTVAIMGSNMSNSQAQMLLEQDKPVYLFYDNDKAGYKAEDQTIKLLDGYLPIYSVTYPPETEDLDPDELTEAEVKLMIGEAKLV